jgi:cell division protease FtsH
MLTCSASGVEASETTEREIDVAVRDIITKSFEQAAASHLLLARETLTAVQFPAIRPARDSLNPWAGDFVPAPSLVGSVVP